MITIVIPAYNRSHLIKRAINSVIAQTETDWELIIADDASEEDIKSVVDGFNDSKIKYVRNTTNKGNAGARNLGVKNATGEYVAFLDSDDEYFPTFLAEIKKIISSSNNPGFVWSNVNRVKEDGSVHPNKFPSFWKPITANNKYEYFLNGIYFGTDFGLTVRKNVFDEVGYFDENLRVSVDTDFILRMSAKTNFNFTNEILVNTYEHSGGRVRTDLANKIKSYEIILEKHSLIKKNNTLLKKWKYKLMWMNFHAGNKPKARKCFYEFMPFFDFKFYSIYLLFELFPKKMGMKIHKKIC